MTYLEFLDSEENNDKVECLSKLSSIEDFLLNKRLLLFAKEVKGLQTTSDRIKILFCFLHFTFLCIT